MSDQSALDRMKNTISSLDQQPQLPARKKGAIKELTAGEARAWREDNGTRAVINDNARNRAERYADIVREAEDHLAENLVEITDALIEQAIAGKPWAIKEALNRIAGMPIQRMEVEENSTKIVITEDRREHIRKLEQAVIAERRASARIGRPERPRIIDGQSHSVGRPSGSEDQTPHEGDDPV